MAREDIVISIRTVGAGKARKDIVGVGTSATAAAKGVRLMNAAIGIFAGAQVLRGIVSMADAFTTIQNRIRVLVDTEIELVGVTKELFDISQSTRTSFEGTADVYARTALAAKELGVSQRQVLDFTKSLNQAVVIGGSTAAEATNAMIQLSQGLASGALRGDELRSVLEQLPVVADVIAKELNVTRGELREMGFQGKITSDIILKAFANAREELEERFGKTIPTIAQGFQVLRNATTLAIGEFATGSGVAEAFARTLIFLGENMDTILRTISSLVIALTLLSGPAVIGRVIIGIKTLTALMIANPFGAFIAAISAAIGILVSFGDKINIFGSGVVTVADVIRATFVEVGMIFAQLAAIAGEAFSSILGSSDQAVEGMVKGFGGLLRIIATIWDGFVGIIAGGILAAAVAWDNFTTGVANVWEKLISFLANKWRDFLNLFIKGYNAVASVFGGDSIELFDERVAETQGTKFGATVGEGFNAGFSAATQANDLLDRIETRSGEIAAKRVEQAAASAEQAAKLEELLNRIGEKAPTGAGGGSGSASETVNRLKALYTEVTGDLDGLIQKQADLNTLFESGAISAEQFAAAMRNINVEVSALDNTFSGGIANGIDQIIARANDLGSTMSDFVVGAFDKASDAIVEFAKTGKFNVREFFSDLFAQLLKLATDQLFASLLGGLFPGGGAGGLFGGGGGGIGGLLGFATGGTAMVGGNGGTDSQLVAFKATPGERVNVETPAQQRANGGGSQPIIVQQAPPNVVVNVGGQEIADALSGAEGDVFFTSAAERNKKAVKGILGS